MLCPHCLCVVLPASGCEHNCGIHNQATFPSISVHMPQLLHFSTPIPTSRRIHPQSWVSETISLRHIPLRPHVSAPVHFLHWLSPFSLKWLNDVCHLLPPHLLARDQVVMACAVNIKILTNYGVGLLRFMQFCDAINVPEYLQMPSPEWLLSIFITTCGAGSVRVCSIQHPPSSWPDSTTRD